MRKSSAPSQLGSLNKKPKFSAPFLINKENTIVSSTNELNTEDSNIVKKIPIPSQIISENKTNMRSADDILNLIKKTKPQLNTIENINYLAHETLDPNSALLKDNINNSIYENTNIVSKSLHTFHDKNESNLQNKKENLICKPIETHTSFIRYFNVLWCKLSKKKHKIWEGDAILKISGRHLYLIDSEGKEIGNTGGYKSAQLEKMEAGQTMIIGGKEIEIVNPLLESDFNNGTCFQCIVNVSLEENIKHKELKTFKPFVQPDKFKSSSKDSKIKASSGLASIHPVDSFIMPRPSDTHQWHNNLNHTPVVEVYLEPFLANHLRKHQKEGLIFLYKSMLGMTSLENTGSSTRFGAILADEMGLGKTLQCISLIWMLIKRGGPYSGKPTFKKCLIIVPGSLVKNWSKEFKKWLSIDRMSVFAFSNEKKIQDFINGQYTPVMIISYEMLIRHIEELKGIKFNLMICDEGHRLKNNNIKTTVYINSLNIERRIVLTGTPIQNDLQELYSLIDFCNPGILGTINSFRNVFELPIIASRESTATEEEIKLGQTRALELSRITSFMVLRRTQEINNQYLPPKVDIILFCSMTPIQLNLYNRLVNSRIIKSCLMNVAKSSTGSQHLACISALKKLCNHPELLYSNCLELEQTRAHFNFFNENLNKDSCDEEDYSNIGNQLYEGMFSCYPDNYKQIDITERAKFGGKMIVLTELLKSFRTGTYAQKVVIVSNYTKTLDFLEEYCRYVDYKFLRLDGKTPTNKRMELVDRFNNPNINDFIFLLSTKAGGVGLNLIGASRLILFDIDWNPANDLQAMARVWRDGQKYKTYVYRLLSTDTIEEKIFQRQISKQSLSGVVIDSKSSDFLPTFSLDQLKELFKSPNPKVSCSTHMMLICNCQKDERANLISFKDNIIQENFNISEDIDLILTNPAHNKLKKDEFKSDLIIERPCQLLVKNTIKKNSCMDELLSWHHISGPNPDLSILDSTLVNGDFSNVTFVFTVESNK